MKNKKNNSETAKADLILDKICDLSNELKISINEQNNVLFLENLYLPSVMFNKIVLLLEETALDDIDVSNTSSVNLTIDVKDHDPFHVEIDGYTWLSFVMKIEKGRLN